MTEGSVDNGRDLPGVAPAGGRQVRAAEVIAAMSLATDLGIGVPLEHGLHSTLIGVRLRECWGVDPEIASQTYYGCCWKRAVSGSVHAIESDVS